MAERGQRSQAKVFLDIKQPQTEAMESYHSGLVMGHPVPRSLTAPGTFFSGVGFKSQRDGTPGKLTVPKTDQNEVGSQFAAIVGMN